MGFQARERILALNPPLLAGEICSARAMTVVSGIDCANAGYCRLPGPF